MFRPRFRRIREMAIVAVCLAVAGCAATQTAGKAAVRRTDPSQEIAQRESDRVRARSATKRPAAKPTPVVPAGFLSDSSDQSESRPAKDTEDTAHRSPADPSTDGSQPRGDAAAVPEPADAGARSPDAAISPADPRPPQPVDLPTALELVDGQNPQVQFARERIQEALAKLDRAEVLWLPSIRAGVNWNKHEGRIQDVAGKVIETSRGSYFTGFGSDAVGAGSPRIPGLIAQFHLADAVFEPRIAQRTAHARQYGSQAATNDALLEAALAYLELLRAHQELAIAREARENTRQLADLTALYARTGQGVAADDDRAQAELAIRDNGIQQGVEEIQVTSARLAQQLSLDPSLRFEPREPIAIPLDLQVTQQPLPDLVAYGLTHRPEVSECRALAGEAAERLRREKYAPLVPSLLLGLSYGGLGGGFGSDFVNFGDRLDADIVAWWELRNLGLGDRAARCEARSRLQQAQWKEVAALDRVAREVVEAQAQVESRRRQIVTAEGGIRAAESSYERNKERIRNAQGLPLEVLQSIQALAQARHEYLRAVISYNQAQFRLQRALGWPVEPVATGG